jgi:hypothetical protein
MKQCRIHTIMALIFASLSTHTPCHATDTLVLAHYMGWYGDSAGGYRLWEQGHPDTPSIGLYNSQHRSLLTYHTLLALKSGIDGFVINCNDTMDYYDFQTAVQLSRVIGFWSSIDSSNYSFRLALSYDDQSRMESLAPNMKFIRDSIIAASSQYLRFNQKPVIFIFNYPGRVTAHAYRSVVDTVFQPGGAFLAWNESDSGVFQYVDACYAWVQPYAGQWDTVNGFEWGSEYLNGHIWRLDNWPQLVSFSRLSFGIGGVWPGFDSRLSWGKNRFIVRRNGIVYDSTWLKFIENNKEFPIPWIFIETWNDFNEGSEIEPSKEYGYQYLLSTAKNIGIFRKTTISCDTVAFSCASRIYLAYNMVETGKRDSSLHFNRIVSAVRCYLQNDYVKAEKYSDSVIGNIVPVIKNRYKNQSAQIPIVYISNKGILISSAQNEPVFMHLFDVHGRCLYSKSLESGSIQIPIHNSGIYLLKLGTRTGEVAKKICIR